MNSRTMEGQRLWVTFSELQSLLSTPQAEDPPGSNDDDDNDDDDDDDEDFVNSDQSDGSEDLSDLLDFENCKLELQNNGLVQQSILGR